MEKNGSIISLSRSRMNIFKLFLLISIVCSYRMPSKFKDNMNGFNVSLLLPNTYRHTLYTFFFHWSVPSTRLAKLPHRERESRTGVTGKVRHPWTHLLLPLQPRQPTGDRTNRLVSYERHHTGHALVVACVSLKLCRCHRHNSVYGVCLLFIRNGYIIIRMPSPDFRNNHISVMTL